MRINDEIKVSIKNVYRNRKKNNIILIPLVISTVLILFAIIIINSMQEYINSIEYKIDMRTIGINYSQEEYDEILKKINNIDNVDMVLNQYEYRIAAVLSSEQIKNKNTDGYVFQKPTNGKTCLEVISGRKINDSDKYKIIIPSKLYSDSKNRPFNKPILEEEFISGKELLGKDITIKVDNEKRIIYKTFQVIGVYDSDRYDDTKTIYIPKSTIKEINQELECKFEEYCMRIVVDKIQNIKKVQNKLAEYGLLTKTRIEEEAKTDKSISIQEHNFLVTSNISVETNKIIKNSIVFLIIATIVLLTVFFIITNINKTYISSKEIGILKSEGYKDREIQVISILENIFVCIIGIIIGVILFRILILIMNITIRYIININSKSLSMRKFQQQLFYLGNIPQKINIKLFIKISVVLIILEILNTFCLNKRILSKKICEMLK